MIHDMGLTLHHCAFNISSNKLELVLELFEKLGCSLTYRESSARWCMVQQKSASVAIQIIEVEDKPIPNIDYKINSHLAFLSNTPKEDIMELEKWAQERNVAYKHGGWSEKEFWFDLPDIFVNFVIEIMHTSIME